jgi:hypothetical protein
VPRRSIQSPEPAAWAAVVVLLTAITVAISSAARTGPPETVIRAFFTALTNRDPRRPTTRTGRARRRLPALFLVAEGVKVDDKPASPPADTPTLARSPPARPPSKPNAAGSSNAPGPATSRSRTCSPQARRSRPSAANSAWPARRSAGCPRRHRRRPPQQGPGRQSAVHSGQLHRPSAPAVERRLHLRHHPSTRRSSPSATPAATARSATTFARSDSSAPRRRPQHRRRSDRSPAGSYAAPTASTTTSRSSSRSYAAAAPSWMRWPGT